MQLYLSRKTAVGLGVPQMCAFLHASNTTGEKIDFYVLDEPALALHVSP